MELQMASLTHHSMLFDSRLLHVLAILADKLHGAHALSQKAVVGFVA